MIRVAQASSSENPGSPKWGVPPNQKRTGVTKARPEGNLDGELNIIPFYGPWERVFRATDSNVAEKIAWIFERAVANGAYIGYGQNNGNYPRTGVFDALARMATPDPGEIRVLCNCDCSSLTGAAVYFAGVKDARLREMWTGTMRQILLSTGEFVEITDRQLLQSAKGARRGDICWKSGHAAVIIDSDITQDFIPCVTANCKACNLRTGPGKEYSVIRALSSGKRIDLVSTASNKWGQFRVDGQYGYISPLYYAPLKTMHAEEQVWLRKDAGKDKAEVIVIPKNATVYVTGNTKKVGLTTWYECIYAGRQGWSSGKYIK